MRPEYGHRPGYLIKGGAHGERRAAVGVGAPFLGVTAGDDGERALAIKGMDLGIGLARRGNSEAGLPIFGRYHLRARGPCPGSGEGRRRLQTCFGATRKGHNRR